MDLLQLFCDEKQDIFQTDFQNQTGLPLLGECILHGSLIYFPCLFLLIFLPLVLFDIYKNNERRKLRLDTPINYRLSLSLILDLILWVIVLNAFHENFIQPLPLQTSKWTAILPFTALATTFTISMILSYMVKKKGLLTSGVLFIFYFLLILSALPELLFVINEILERRKLTVHGILFLPYFIVAFLILVLSCFADRPAQRYDK
uniref:DUF3267 domain-containing protein n=2 Tax=Bursaphelenchus xylophilus TaxID=6326 RepID=A0A1I7SIR9_BURXY